jgi:hypothetical protein
MRLTYRNYGNRLAVTPTGRAKSPGRVTRASLSVGRSGFGSPLPIDLQCHPKALSRTPYNPGCFTSEQPWGGRFLHHKAKAKARPHLYFTERAWPMEGRYALYVQGVLRFRTDDMLDAYGWRMAARDSGYLDTQLFVEA